MDLGLKEKFSLCLQIICLTISSAFAFTGWEQNHAQPESWHAAKDASEGATGLTGVYTMQSDLDSHCYISSNVMIIQNTVYELQNIIIMALHIHFC